MNKGTFALLYFCATLFGNISSTQGEAGHGQGQRTLGMNLGNGQRVGRTSRGRRDGPFTTVVTKTVIVIPREKAACKSIKNESDQIVMCNYKNGKMSLTRK